MFLNTKIHIPNEPFGQFCFLNPAKNYRSTHRVDEVKYHQKPHEPKMNKCDSRVVIRTREKLPKEKVQGPLKKRLISYFSIVHREHTKRERINDQYTKKKWD